MGKPSTTHSQDSNARPATGTSTEVQLPTKQPSANVLPSGVATTATSTEVQLPTKHPVRSAAERLRLVEEYDSFPTGSPERGALLRRQGIYTSQIAKWRKLRTKGALAALTTKASGPKPDPLQTEIDRLRKENACLQARLSQAETIIDVQKKVAALLGSTPAPLSLENL